MVCTFISRAVFAQPTDYVSAKEKIYIHTNHSFFKPGEQLYFKLYLLDAKDQTPSTISASVNVEILNPSGNSIQKLNYKVENGYTEGSYDFPEATVGGIYKLKAYTTWMQNEKDSTFFTKEITVQKVIAPRVLMKLDFPKKGYGVGDEVMADFSMRSLDNQPIKEKQANYTVSVGGKVVETNTFKTNYQGKAQVYFTLPKELTTNDGLLNITINHDAYTEAISRSIPIVLNKIDLQFMPEGGTLVEGLPTHIAFKVLNENGKAADIKGEVIDNRGNKIASLESYHFGMGSFAFTPQQGLFYTVKITSPTNIAAVYPLPMAMPNGVVMNIQQEKNEVLVTVKSTTNMELRLIGQTKNVNFFSTNISLQKGEQVIRVDGNKFPAGIAQFTLYSAGAMPLAERLVFLNSDKVLQVKITTDKEKYQPREKVTMTLKTLDDKGQPIPSNFSMAVVDDKLWSYADDKQDHILSWLLLSSELKGKIEEPQFYFKKEEAKSIPALDLVMLTHGYRYFQFIEYVQENNKLKYTPDLGSVLSGTIVNKFNEPVKATVFLVGYYTNNKAIKMKTDEDGIFCFPNITARASYYIIAKSQKDKEEVVIKVEQNGIGYNPVKAKMLKRVNAENDKDFAAIKPFVQPLKQELQKQNKEVGFDRQKAAFGKEQNLEDVVVVGYGTQKKANLTASIVAVRSNELQNVPIAGLAQALQGKVAGLSIVQAGGNPGEIANIRLRGSGSIAGNNEPLLVLDGVPMDKFSLNNLNPNDIGSVDVLKDASATALYGARGANGVIVIQSKQLRKEKISFNLSKKSFFSSLAIYSNAPTYAIARKFYAPMYQSLETEERSDFRETIYWNPVVQTDKTGTAKIEFWNSDATTTFRAIAEGIAFNGKLGRTEATYAVQNAITVDAKIPPYLTVGDKALLPLNIKNNTAMPIEISVEVDSVPNILLGKYDKQISLEAGKAKQVLVPVEATAAMKGTIRFFISGQFSTESLALPIEATDKGFPIIETYAGNTSTKHNFNINKMILGSLQSELRLFKNLEGRLLDGIESMLREPYGCFEQTSSSTYPNIFVLKYLRESNKSNPALEKKALGYIEAGYKRLIGFETSENGFEWFGHAPAHEALTAYGLLEFTDMQEFINVDKGMLERTKKFLMGKRNGDGTFNIASGGYDRFASVPNKIANVYIVYALTQAGVGKEIQLEYATAVKQAIKSKDGYQMAMMAIAASNMNNEDDFAKLMELLNDSYRNKNLASETSVVNSRDASLRVESLALYSMALAREKSPKIELMAALISKILNEKSYYGYGSTQGTVLALNAVVTYGKLIGKMAEEGAAVDFLVNDKKAELGTVSSALADGENTFAINYSNTKNAIPYQLQVSYNTFTPPNSTKASLKLSTKLLTSQTKVGETVRMEIEVGNGKDILQPMAIAKIGIPAGLSTQPWQLKEMMEKNQVAYYEIFDNYLVLYWMGFAVNETKKINLDLKAEIPGTYKAKASNTYLYYTPEYKHWNDGVDVEVKE